MKKLLFSAAIVLVLLLGLALALPSWLDWTVYRDEVGAALSQRIGRHVDIAGHLDIALVPEPRIEAHDIRVSAGGGGQDPLMTVAALEARFDPWALLAGRLVVERMVLVRPTVFVEHRADGTMNWAAGTAEQAATSLSIDRAAIDGGTLVVRTADGEWRAERIGLDLSARDLDGPLGATGSLSVADVPLTVSLQTGRRVPSGGWPINLSVAVSGADAETRFAGLAAFSGRAQGNLAVEGNNLTALLGRFFPDAPIPVGAAQPFTLAAQVNADGEGLAFDDLIATLGQGRATGTVSAVFGDPLRVETAVAVNRIILSDWLGNDVDWSRFSLPRRLALPPDVELDVDVTVNTATYRDGQIRQVRLTGGLADAGITVSRFSAQLPGGSDIAMIGELSATAEGRPFVDISAEATSNDLRSALDWLGADMGDIPAGRMRRFSAGATLTGTVDSFQLTGVDATLDTTRVTGGLAYVNRGQAGIGLRLTVDRLDLDSYAPTVPTTPLLPGLGLPESIDGLLAGAAAINANLDVEIGALTAGGAMIEDVRVDATLSGGAAVLREVRVGRVAGAALSLAGMVSSLDPVDGIDLTAGIASADLAPFLDLLGAASPVPPDWLRGIDAIVTVSGGPDTLGVAVQGEIADAVVDVGGTIADVGGAPSADIAVRASHADLFGLLAPVTGGYRPIGPFDGADLFSRIATTPTGLTLSDLRGTAGPVALAGEAAIDLTGDRPVVTGSLRADAVDLDALLPARPGPRAPVLHRSPWLDLDLDPALLPAVDGALDVVAGTVTIGGRQITDVATRLTVSEDGATIDGLTGGVFGGALSLDGGLQAVGTASTMHVDAALVGADFGGMMSSLLGAEGVDGTVDIALHGSADGAGVGDWIGSLDGGGRITVRDGAIDGFDPAVVAVRLDNTARPFDFPALLRSLGEGRVRFASLTAPLSIEDGVVATNAMRLATATGPGEGRGMLDLESWHLDLTAEFRIDRHPNAPPFGFRLVGAPERPTRRLQTRALQAYLAQRAAEALADRYLPSEEGDD